MEFNPDPTKQAVEILFSQKKKELHHPPLNFNGSVVSKVDFHKHLGLILDSKLIFNNHINEKIKATTKAIGILKYLYRYLSINSLNHNIKCLFDRILITVILFTISLHLLIRIIRILLLKL